MSEKLPGPPMEVLFPDVKPIPGELLRFRVASRSCHDSHLVDLGEHGFNGLCGCEAFRYRYEPKLAHGIPTDNTCKCYHIKRAEAFFLEEMKRTLWVSSHAAVPAMTVATTPWPEGAPPGQVA